DGSIGDDRMCHIWRRRAAARASMSVAATVILATAVIGLKPAPASAETQGDSSTPSVQSETAAAAASERAKLPFDASLSASITSDYNYRGYTLSNHQLSGAADLEATYSIFFAGINVASVDNLPRLSQIQMTSSVGIRPVFGPLTIEAGVGYYSYPMGEINSAYPEYYVTQ